MVHDFKMYREQIDRLEAMLGRFALREPGISNWSVGEHLEHIIEANLFTLKKIDKNIENGPEPGPKLKLIGRLVLFWGWIPKGSGKSPSFLIPKGNTLEQVRHALNEYTHLTATLDSHPYTLQKSRYAFPHPFFGMLTVKQWLRMTEVHTNHHLKIMQAICRAHEESCLGVAKEK